MMNGPQAKLRQIAIDALMARGMTRGEATVAVDKLSSSAMSTKPPPRYSNNNRSVFPDWGKTFRITNFEELNETEAAYLFAIGDDEVWIPKSQIVKYEPGNLVITLWIAKKKGLNVQTCH